MIYANATAQPRNELTEVVMEGMSENDEFVGLKVLPPAPSSLLQLHAPKIKISTGNFLRASNRVRTPGTNFDRWQSAIDQYSATLLNIGDEISIPDEVALTYDDYFSIESVYSKEAGNRVVRGLELDAAAALFNTANFDVNNGGVAYSAANLATLTPVADITAAIRLIKARGERPNTILFPGVIYDRVRASADMKAYIAGSINPGSVVSPDTIQSAFSAMGIKQVLISDAYVNQSQDGMENSINPIFPPTHIFVGNASSGAIDMGGVGRSFYWEKIGPIINVMTYRDEPKQSNIIRAQRTTIEGITNSRAGTLIATQVTT